MEHNDYYQLYKDMDFINPDSHYTKADRIKLKCPDRITHYEIHRYLMLCYECRQAEVAGAPIPEVALNAKHKIIRIAIERPKKEDCSGLFMLCYDRLPL